MQLIVNTIYITLTTMIARCIFQLVMVAQGMHDLLDPYPPKSPNFHTPDCPLLSLISAI